MKICITKQKTSQQYNLKFSIYIGYNKVVIEHMGCATNKTPKSKPLKILGMKQLGTEHTWQWTCVIYYFHTSTGILQTGHSFHQVAAASEF